MNKNNRKRLPSAKRRAAIDDLMSRGIPMRLRVGVFRSPALGSVSSPDREVGERPCGERYDRVEVHATIGDVRHAAFWRWLEEDVRTRLDGMHVADAIAVHVYPGEACRWRIMHAHTEDEIRVRCAISAMPGGGSRSSISRAGSLVGFRGAAMAPVEAGAVADYLEVLSEIRREELDDLAAARKRLRAVESDLAAVARVFGGAKTAADREVPE